MSNNLEKFKADLESLITRGDNLVWSMKRDSDPNGFKDLFENYAKQNNLSDEDKQSATDYINKLPNFYHNYQLWYTEAYVVIKTLIPDRLKDFVKCYEKAPNRKRISY